MLKITSYTQYSYEDLFSKLREVRLKGFGQPLIYEKVDLSLVEDYTRGQTVPTQRYVLNDRVKTLIELYHAFEEFNIDIFNLYGYLEFSLEEGPDAEVIPLLPPILEVWPYQTRANYINPVIIDQIISDGIHRIQAAHEVGTTFTAVKVEEISIDYPYYAYRLLHGWGEVACLDELPDTFQKKYYRNPLSYKDLFRLYNDVFPGVQKVRKDSNPSHIKAG